MVASYGLPLKVYAGKNWGEDWDIGPTADGPAVPLDHLQAVEFRMERQGPPQSAACVVWTLATGHLTVADDVISLRVAGDETEALAAGTWRFLLSVGSEPGEAEDAIADGLVVIVREPGCG